MRGKIVCSTALIAALFVIGCSRGPDYADPQWLKERYGVAHAFNSQVPTATGSMDATVVPVTLEDGRTAQLIIPRQKNGHSLLLRDQEGIHPVVLEERNISRERFVRSKPVVVERRVVRTEVKRPKKRSLKKEVLIVAGSAGAGAAIGGVAAGKKGAAVGALSGGIAGLVYDLATRK